MCAALAASAQHAERLCRHASGAMSKAAQTERNSPDLCTGFSYTCNAYGESSLRCQFSEVDTSQIVVTYTLGHATPLVQSYYLLLGGIASTSMGAFIKFKTPTSPWSIRSCTRDTCSARITGSCCRRESRHAHISPPG